MACQLSRPALAMRGRVRAVLPFGGRSLGCAVVIGSLLALAACAGLGRKSTAELDSLLQQGRSVEAAEALRAAKGDKPFLEWLVGKARAGYPLAQYELALRGMALEGGEQLTAEWYARARLALILDGAECRGSQSSMLFGLYLDSAYKRLDDFARTHQDLFATASQSALAADAKASSRPSAGWICDPEAKRSDGNLLAPSEASAARARERQRLEARTESLVQQQALAKAPVNPDGFKVIQPPSQISNSRIHFWMDDARLVVRARVGQEEQVWMWNVETGGIERVRRLEGAGDVCYYQGFVRYQRSAEGVTRLFEGPWGEEKEVWQAPITKGEPTFPPPHNHFSCRAYRKEELPLGATTPLLDGHGYLGYSPPNSNPYDNTRKFSILDLDGVELRQLSFPYRATDWPPRFVPFANAYVFVNRQWSRDNPLAMIVVPPHDAEKILQFPKGPWHGGSPRLHLTRVGLLIASNASLSRSAGIYLVDHNGVVKKLVAATDQAGALPSPSGCRIASTHGASNSWRESLSTMELCLENGK